jgi:hypothetical protein
MYAIRTEITDLNARDFDFPLQKTMYGGKQIAAGDTIFLFASELAGGPGLMAQGVVCSAQAVPPRPGLARQTPRVSITVHRTAAALRQLGRHELKAFAGGLADGPQAELHFKFYRQATHKIVGLSEAAAAFLRSHFPKP